MTVAAGLGGTGCSSRDDNEEARSARSSSQDAAQDDARTSEPSDDETAATTTEVEELLRRYDDAVATIIADPGVVRARSAAVVVEYLDLFEPGSEVADDALAGWVESAEAGTTVRPLNADASTIVSRLEGPLEAISRDEVGFATCSEHHYQLYDGAGVLQDVVDMVGRAGEGTAVRIDGRWHLRRLELRDDRPTCDTTASDNDTTTTEEDGS